MLCSYSLRCLSVSKCGDSSCGQTVRLTATVIYYALRDQSDGSYINCWLVDQLVGILCLVFSPCSLDLGTQKHALISNIVLFPSELLLNLTVSSQKHNLIPKPNLKFFFVRLKSKVDPMQTKNKQEKQLNENKSKMHRLRQRGRKDYLYTEE